LEGKLTSQDYDIALRSVNIGLNKDISTLFSTTDPVINPSMQRNDALSSLITDYFLTDDEVQKDSLLHQIQTIYRQSPQLYILGKQMGTVRIRRQGGFTYPEKLYVLGRRKSLLQKIQLFKHINIDRDKAVSFKQILKFIGESL